MPRLSALLEPGEATRGRRDGCGGGATSRRLPAASSLAVWFLLHWTVPSPGGYPIDRYEVRVGNANAAPAPASLYENPATLVPHGPPGVPDTPDSGYVSVTADPLSPLGVTHGGAVFQLRVANALGDQSPWSNQVILATAAKDTNYTDGRTWRRGPVLRFERNPVDTLLLVPGLPDGPLVTQEAWTRLVRPTVCATFGYWSLWGMRLACP